MRHQIIGLVFAAALAACIDTSHAQPPEPVRTLGIAISSHPSAVPFLDALRAGLRERGWIEGRNLRLEIRYVSRYEHDAAAMAEFVRLAVDVIFVPGVTLAMAARDATASIPIVFWMGVDPVNAGLVESYSRPGRNLTGIAGSAVDLVAKQLELLLEAVPRIRRVALLINPDTPNAEAAGHHALQAAHELGLQLQVVKARNAPEVTRGLTEIRRTAADALVIAAAGPLRHEYERIAAFAIANRLPMIATDTSDESLDAACLLRYGPSHPDALRRAAHHIDRILKGAKPADLPVERASRFHLVVNLKVARAIGVVVPDHLLRIADEVIE
jgi:putative tryptophan/tyrosine transport system substrate-binding protein